MKKILLAIVLLIPAYSYADFIEIEIVPSTGAWFTMTGGFDYDATTSTYSNLTFNITGSIGPFNFTDTPCDTCALSGSSVGLIDPAISLNFLSDLTVTWGNPPFDPAPLDAIFRGNSFSMNSSNGRIGGEYRFIVPAEELPEPGVLSLLGLGLAGVALSRRRLKA